MPLLLSTCKPDDDVIWTEPIYLGEGGNYIYFTQGWWKYKNTVTEEIDSTILVSSNRRVRHYTCGESNNSLKKEDITFRTESKTVCVDKDFRIRQAWGCQPTNTLNRYFEFFAKDYCQNFSESVVFYYPFDLSSSGNSGQDVVFNQLHDSLKVQDQWYYDVAEFEVDIDYIWDNKITKYFWAKNVGLIKREKYAHWTREFIESWELVEFDVSQ